MGIMFKVAILSLLVTVPSIALAKESPAAKKMEQKAPFLRLAPLSKEVPFYLEWTSVGNAEKYEVQLGTDANFKKARLYSANGNRWDSSSKEIKKNTTYWMRVRASGPKGQKGDWSYPVSFIM